MSNAIAKAMSEAELQANVIDAAKKLGWLVYHSRKTATRRRDGTIVYHTPLSGDKGFPDLFLARNGRHIISELKSEKGKLSADQRLWIEALGGLGQGHHMGQLVGVFVWRPSHWLSGEIEEILR